MVFQLHTFGTGDPAVSDIDSGCDFGHLSALQRGRCSPLTGTKSTKEKSKQNITRDIEVKNNLTITRVGRGQWGLQELL